MSAFVCPYTAKNNGTFSYSYTLITYNVNDLVLSTCSNASTVGSSRMCWYNTTGLPFGVTGVRTAVERVTISAVMTTYTYFSLSGAYF